MQEMIAFFDVWGKFVKTELKPVITLGLDEKGYFFTCFLYCIIECLL
jgi:hypothetical protein